jgi:hypothetical protein
MSEPMETAVVFRVNDKPELETWEVLRQEPNGSMVVQKGTARISVTAVDFEKLNFPGSAMVARTLSSFGADAPILTAFAHGDYGTVSGFIFRHLRDADPSFSGVKNEADLIHRVALRIAGIKSSLDTLKRDLLRARHEYDGLVTHTMLENDHKDGLLTDVRTIEDQYATRHHEHDVLMPLWQDAVIALKALASR